MDAPAQYLEELRSDLALYPQWLPFDNIELGAFGTIKRGQFVKDGSLADLDIAIVSKPKATDGSFRKSRGVKSSATTSANADAGLVDVSLGVELHFERSHSWLFDARGVNALELDNIFAVRRAVLEAHKRGDWEPEWLLVSEVRSAENLNVLIARSNNVRVRVVAKGTLVAADLALSTDATFEYHADDFFAVEDQKNSTPLYGLRKLQGFLRPGLEPIHGGAPQDDALVLEVANEEPFGL